MKRLVVVDYGAGNLRSVMRAVERVGGHPELSDNPAALDSADALIVPGDGAAADTMRHLREHGMIEPIRGFIAEGRPFMGVCMGMQVLFTRSEENDGQECLDIIPGTVRLLPSTPEPGSALASEAPERLKVPHMGWNRVYWQRPHFITDGVPDGSYFYFLHSYHAVPDDPAVVIGAAQYGRPVTAVIAHENIVGTQFHPEKSGECGLRLYANFLAHLREEC